jgi:hypothetical protein
LPIAVFANCAARQPLQVDGKFGFLGEFELSALPPEAETISLVVIF